MIYYNLKKLKKLIDILKYILVATLLVLNCAIHYEWIKDIKITRAIEIAVFVASIFIFLLFLIFVLIEIKNKFKEDIESDKARKRNINVFIRERLYFLWNMLMIFAILFERVNDTLFIIFACGVLVNPIVIFVLWYIYRADLSKENIGNADIVNNELNDADYNE